MPITRRRFLAAGAAFAGPEDDRAAFQKYFGQRFPTVVSAWRRAWDKVIPFFAFPPEVRRVIYTTNAIESVNTRLRKIIKTRGHFPSDEAATKLIWLALRNITADWGRAATSTRPHSLSASTCSFQNCRSGQSSA